MSNDWQPTATIETLKKRAGLLAQIRSFFMAQSVMEVDTQLLGEYGVTEPNIDNIEATVCGQSRYLQSSPEYYMKRLLAAGSGPIYCLGKVFRDGEKGSRHHPEFTLLEWYRPGWDEWALMDEVGGLLATLSPRFRQVRRFSYREAFFDATGFDPHGVDIDVLRQLASRASSGGNWQQESRATCLDLLFSLVVEPTLHMGVVMIYDYPQCQAALACLGEDATGVTVARRFEVFIDGMEIGNGYFELTDPVQQRQRFDGDIELRHSSGKKHRSADQRLLAALEAGLPPCAGVALGVDRLLMRILDIDRIDGVLPFAQ